MAFSRTEWLQKAFAVGVSALALGLTGTGAANAQAFGTDGEAASSYQFIDSNGVHNGATFNCLGIPSGGSAWCGGGARSSSTGWSTSTFNAQQGFISGGVHAQNSDVARIRSAAAVDASWWDTFTVDGGGLAAGTIVDLRLMVNLQASDFTASTAAPPPYTRVQASINLGGHDAPATAGATLYADGLQTGSGILRVAVDTPFVLWGVFFTSTNVNDSPIDLGNIEGLANYYVDFVGVDPQLNGRVSALGANALDPQSFDPQVITASGHDYSSLAPSGGVPEPAAWAMMIAGLGMVGAVARLRVRKAGGLRAEAKA